MHKMKLDLDSLTVESFSTGAVARGTGTVRGHATLNAGPARCNYFADTHDAAIGCDNTTVPSQGAYSCQGCGNTQYIECTTGTVGGSGDDLVCQGTQAQNCEPTWFGMTCLATCTLC